MGYDHAEQKELEPNIGSSGSSEGSSSGYGPTDPEKQNWQEKSRRDTADTARTYDADDTGLELRKTHTHTLGKLKLRAADDDLPTDWWFASTAIPLIAATFAPMANLLSIAGLVVFWRNRVTNFSDPGLRQSTSTGYPDPAWCYDLNVASLLCGFVGNLFLLFNFTRRVRYIVALPATIILFYIASGILIGITASMNEHVPPGKDEIYSQGYWHAIIAACLYLFNSMILMVNMMGYFLGHYPQHFTLTDEQRNLILQTMMFFIWLGGGAAVFARIEGWSYPDALYFCDVTILTIGFGDFYPTDDLGRGLVFPFSVGGTIILGLMVSSIHRFAGELSKDKVLRKHVESRRVNTLSRAITIEADDERRRNELEKNFKHGKRPSISAPLANPDIQRDLDTAALKERQIGFDDTAKIDDLKRAAEEEPAPNQFMNSSFRGGWARNTLRAFTTPMVTVKKIRSRTQKALVMREEKDKFDAMRRIQHDAGQFKKWYALTLSAIAFGLLWCVGAIVFWVAERQTQNMSYFRALYFCYVSLLTIGYGDESPKSNAGKPFFIFWSLVAVPTMTILISDMGDTVIAGFKRGTFKLADFTVLPKAGMWHDILESHPWLLRWMTRRVEKKRVKKGLPVGPGLDSGEDPSVPNIETLASEHLSQGQLTKKLAFAIRKTADDLAHHPGKRYTYEEWVEFTRLIRFTKMDLSELEHDEDQEGVVEWDWLEENSPMLSEQSESEWILDRLCESLLRLLRKNNIGLDGGDDSSLSLIGGIPGQPESTDDSVDPKDVSNAAKDTGPSAAQERRQRAAGADALLTFFTGERRGTRAYAANEPIWSKKAQERQQTQRRKSSTGVERRGPFSKLHHGGKTGAVGGGRGGAGSRTLKAKRMLWDGN